MDEAQKDAPPEAKKDGPPVVGKADDKADAKGAGPAPAPLPAPVALAPTSLGVDMKLVGLCVLLWAVAVGIFFSSWEDTKKDYYWGNIRQSLEQPGLTDVDHESIDALAAMGEAVLPSCEHELKTQPDPLFKVAVLHVLKKVPGPKSAALLGWAAENDADARVRANGLIVLRERAKTVAEEKALLQQVAKDLVKNEREPAVQSIAAVILGESGDTSPELAAFLVHGLRLPLIRKDAWQSLKATHPSIPPVDAPTEDDARKQIMAVETWCDSNGIALVTSKLEMLGPDGKPLKSPGGVAAPTSPSTDKPPVGK